LDTGFSGDLRRIRGGRKPRSRLYDRVGLPIVLIAVFLSSLFSPLVFLGDFFAALVGMLPKIEAGKLELNSEPVNLARLIDEVIGTAEQLAEKNQNRLIEAQENLGMLTAARQWVGGHAGEARAPWPRGPFSSFDSSQQFASIIACDDCTFVD